MKQGEIEYIEKKPFEIDSPETFVWATSTYEKNISEGRRKGRYLFNKLFDFGQKVVLNDIPFVIPKIIKED